MTTLWIVESRYLKSGEEIMSITPQHRDWLDQHYRNGVFITSGRRVDKRGGILLARAESQHELEDIFAEDPFVINDCAEYTYTPFNPVKRSLLLDVEDIPLVE